MDKDYVEKRAYELNKRLWQRRFEIWPGGIPDPIEMLAPEIVARHVLGIKYEFEEGLGKFGNSASRFEVAGAINREKKLIQISNNFSPQIRRFTGAHEIGHWILHPREVMHRDPPLGKHHDSKGRTPEEAEADYFAACFLMPPNLLRSKVKETFGLEPPLIVDDDMAFYLNPNGRDELINPPPGMEIREHALASVTRYERRSFDSLADQFHVSERAMAIRLKELHIFRW